MANAARAGGANKTRVVQSLPSWQWQEIDGRDPVQTPMWMKMPRAVSYRADALECLPRVGRRTALPGLAVVPVAVSAAHVAWQPTTRAPLLSECTAQVTMRQRAITEVIPNAGVVMSPTLGAIPANHQRCSGRLAGQTSRPYCRDSSLVRLSKAYASTAGNRVTFGTVAAHRVPCPRTCGGKVPKCV
jgi:hypothetical protein